MSDNRTSPKGRTPTRRQAFALFCIAAVGLFASALVQGALPADMNEYIKGLTGNLLFYLVFLALPVLACLRRGPGSFECLRPNPIGLGSTIVISLMAVLAVFFVNDIIVLWSIPLQKLGFDVNASAVVVPEDTAGLLLCMFSGAVLPGICEELLFRGAIMPAFEERGTRRAIRISSFMFMLLHGSVVGAPAQFLLGVIIAELVLCCDSIYAGLIFHTAYNAAVFIIVFLQQRLVPDAGPVTDYFEYLGGWGGVLSLLLSVALSAMLIRMLLRIFRLRAAAAGVKRIQDSPAPPLSGGETALLLAGIALALLLYGLDIAAMLL